MLQLPHETNARNDTYEHEAQSQSCVDSLMRDAPFSRYGKKAKFPRVLNIIIGQNTNIDEQDTFVNISVENTASLAALRLDEGIFLVVRLSAAAELLSGGDDVVRMLSECRRILNRHGELQIQSSGLRGSAGRTAQLSTVPLVLRTALINAGFKDIYIKDDLPQFLGRSNRHNVISKTSFVVAKLPMVPHNIDPPFGAKSFTHKCELFRAAHPILPDVSYVITVYNEEKNLPHFLSFLENIRDESGFRREFIFVLNGCTDRSEEIIQDFLAQTRLVASVTTSLEMGILPAFKKGMRDRKYDGFVGRFDADIFLHPQTLDLMQMHLFENKLAQVTYAEPLSMDSPSAYNEPWYNPSIFSKRLYYTGKTSLYKENPHARPEIKDMPPNLIADDIFTSFYFTYFYGLDAISRAPHALVYEKVVNNFDDLVSQQSRCDSEIKRVLDAYPYIRNLGDITVQQIYPSAYKDLIDKAKAQSTYVDNWVRLESTK